MEKINLAADWIDSYLDWGNDGWAATSPATAQGESEVDFCAVYLGWMDGNSWSGRERRDPAGQARGRRASDAVASAYGFREAVLLAALHSQSDCLHILRQFVGSGSANVGTMRLAVEALDHAQRLIDDERLARQALDDLHGFGERRTGDRQPSNIGAEWPRALEHVVADVRALTNTVMAMRIH